VWPACNRDRDLADEPHWCSSAFGCRNACGIVDKIDIVEVDDIFGYDWGARAPRVLVLAPKRTSDDLIFDSGFSR
jgi:hypothetical protein